MKYNTYYELASQSNGIKCTSYANQTLITSKLSTATGLFLMWLHFLFCVLYSPAVSFSVGSSISLRTKKEKSWWFANSTLPNHVKKWHLHDKRKQGVTQIDRQTMQTKITNATTSIKQMKNKCHRVSKSGWKDIWI